ncbi:hypothetical protein AN958_10918 [Leucoagaricus sp. SymC.cos]|nr:hypothetical protein AN958_10918 [Leucoagaricus sp. SymC.cos]
MAAIATATTTTTSKTTTTTQTVSIVETVHGTDKKPRSLLQWEETARGNTQKITQLGSNVPLAWVLVRGNNIPPNAIIAGEDKRRPLYIARTFYEGGVHIGQAGQHLEKGASFAYNGREVHVDTFEVLVPMQQTITYRVSDSYRIPTIPRITRFETSEQTDVTLIQLVEKLRAVKVVMVVDDSVSMEGSLWNQARAAHDWLVLKALPFAQALIGLVSIIESDIETNGIDLCFLNNPTFEANIRDRGRIEHLFNSVFPQGTTPTGQKLRELFNRYIPLIESPNSTSPPIVLMVITDGVPTDDVDSAIIEGARRLDRNQVPQHRFGVSFVQIGNDPDAAEFLRELDDDISVRFGCRDMVDTTPFDQHQSTEFTRDVFLKCVLGAIDPYYDNQFPHLESPNPEIRIYDTKSTSPEHGFQHPAFPVAAGFPSPSMPTHHVHPMPAIFTN